MRQGNDVGTQYRSAIYYFDDEQRRKADATRRAYGQVVREAGYRPITTEIGPAPEFYYAEQLSPAVPGQEPTGVLRPRRNRGDVPSRRRFVIFVILGEVVTRIPREPWIGCVVGALAESEYRGKLAKAGFE